MNVQRIHILERPGRGRLGRHVEHDQRSRAFGVFAPGGTISSVTWQRHCAPFDQGDLGSCTGNAMAGALMTGPLYKHGRELSEVDAVRLYEMATKLDGIPGEYPPDDTGSSGLAVAKAARRMGMLTAYHHAFGLSAALHALSRGPILLGMNWYSGFDTPVGGHAELVIAGEIRGGHEVCLDTLDVENGYVGGTNSWGQGWGNAGMFVMSFGTFGDLLKDWGDIVVPVH